MLTTIVQTREEKQQEAVPLQINFNRDGKNKKDRGEKPQRVGREKSKMNMRAAIFHSGKGNKGGNFLSLTDALSGLGTAVPSRL